MNPPAPPTNTFVIVPSMDFLRVRVPRTRPPFWRKPITGYPAAGKELSFRPSQAHVRQGAGDAAHGADWPQGLDVFPHLFVTGRWPDEARISISDPKSPLFYIKSPIFMFRV